MGGTNLGGSTGDVMPSDYLRLHSSWPVVMGARRGSGRPPSMRLPRWEMDRASGSRPGIYTHVFGDRDDRRWVERVDDIPFRYNAQLMAYASRQPTVRVLGTGFLMTPTRLVTAAHNMLVRSHRATRWEVFFKVAGDRMAAQVYRYRGVRVRIHPDFRRTEAGQRYDIATVEIEPIERPLPTNYGALRILQVNPGQLTGHWGLIAGYPRDVPQPWAAHRDDDASQYQAFGQLMAHRDGLVHHPIDTSVGQSGSPIVVRVQEAGRAFSAAAGLHAHSHFRHGRLITNTGVAFEHEITDFLFDQWHNA